MNIFLNSKFNIFRDVGQRSNVVEHIYGVKYITDVILGLKFRISPESFFQVTI